jgi:hypothetical protein
MPVLRAIADTHARIGETIRYEFVSPQQRGA